MNDTIYIKDGENLKKRKLGNTDIYLTELGYGCASLWGKKAVRDDEAIELFMAAYDRGIRFFDTGYSYGMAEERLGRCLKELGNEARKNIILSTKCGTRRSPQGKYYHDWSVEWLKESVEISLRRMETDYVDLLHVHGPAIENITPEMLKFLARLKEQGTVKAVGINTFDTEVIKWTAENKVFDFVMLDYNILRQDREEIIDLLFERGIGVIAGAPLAQSLYSNRVYKIKNVKDLWYFLRVLKNFRGHMAEGRRYRFINKVDGYSGNQLALRYVLDNKKVSAAVFGTVSIEHLIENSGAVDIVMPEEVRKKIQKRGKADRRGLDRK